MVRPRNLAPVNESLEKIEEVVNDGNYYEAQQMYKSISARYTSAQRHLDASDILQSGACLQLKKGQVICGAELGALFVETLSKGKIPCNKEIIDRIRQIYRDFPHVSLPQQVGLDDDMQKLSEALGAAKTRVKCCSSFLKAAIRWSAETGMSKYGSPELHDMLAEYVYSESPELDMTKVSFHFVRGCHPEKFAVVLVNFMGKGLYAVLNFTTFTFAFLFFITDKLKGWFLGFLDNDDANGWCYPGEDDLAIARAVLMYLSLGNMKDANNLMDELKNQVECKQLDFPRSELMRFINYLLETLERDALPLFMILRKNFKSSIEREHAFDELLDEIGERFYGVKRKTGMGIFGDLFKMMGEMTT